MKSDRPMKHFILAFLLAVGCYAVFYSVIEHRRTMKGPWEVAFTNNPAGKATVVINQLNLAITNVQLVFADESASATNQLKTVVFRQPQPVPYDVPFGQCLFMDTTFLPGTVTFRLFGHEIELLPRALIIDRQEHPWIADGAITLHAVAATAPPRTATTQ